MQRHAPDRATFGLPATMPERYGCPDAGYIAATITRTMRSLTTMRTTIILTTGAAKPCVSPDSPQHPEPSFTPASAPDRDPPANHPHLQCQLRYAPGHR